MNFKRVKMRWYAFWWLCLGVCVLGGFVCLADLQRCTYVSAEFEYSLLFRFCCLFCSSSHSHARLICGVRVINNIFVTGHKFLLFNQFLAPWNIHAMAAAPQKSHCH